MTEPLQTMDLLADRIERILKRMKELQNGGENGKQ